jgi:hypothetical protein
MALKILQTSPEILKGALKLGAVGGGLTAMGTFKPNNYYFGGDGE